MSAIPSRCSSAGGWRRLLPCLDIDLRVLVDHHDPPLGQLPRRRGSRRWLDPRLRLGCRLLPDVLVRHRSVRALRDLWGRLDLGSGSAARRLRLGFRGCWFGSRPAQVAGRPVARFGRGLLLRRAVWGLTVEARVSPSTASTLRRLWGSSVRSDERASARRGLLDLHRVFLHRRHHRDRHLVERGHGSVGRGPERDLLRELAIRLGALRLARRRP